MMTILAAATFATLLGRGPFAYMPGDFTVQLLALQAFVAVCFCLSLPVAAQMRRSSRLQAQLAQALAMVRESEKRRRVIATNMSDIVMQLDRELRILYVSPSAAQLGYSPDEMIGHRGSEFIHPDEIPRLLGNLAHLLTGAPETGRDRRHRLRMKDGSYRWYDGNPSHVFDEAGAVVGFVNIIRDVHDTVLSAEALAESEERYRLLAENMSDIIVQLDARGRIQYVSPSCSVLGYAPEELIGRDPSEFIHVDLLDNMAVPRTGVLDHRRDRSHPIRLKGGGYRWYDGAPNPILDENGQLLGFVNVFRDIHEAKAAEEAVAASEARYRLLADNMGDIVACYGRDGILTFVSGATMATLGYEPVELVGRAIRDIIHPEDREVGTALYERQAAEGPGAPAFRFECRMRCKGGALVWLEAHPRAFFDADGRFIEWQDVVRDITEHKSLEEQLRAARRKADASARTKAEFLADMSHELRGPLNSVVGFARLARSRPRVPAMVRTYLERIEGASVELIRMVTDILEFSRLEAAEVVFLPRPLAISELARAALSFLEPQAAAKDLELTLIDRTPAGLIVSLDGGRVRQVLLNLLSNAVKFTHAGRVTLELRHDAKSERLTVKVRDTGPGIPPDRIGRLFYRFTQVSDDLGLGAYAGAGLGLAISKGIVDGLGGEISATSTVGRGSCFRFWVPAPAASEPAEEADEPGARFRILVADGDVGARELITRMLAPLRAEVLCAADGEAVLKLASREAIDIIVADLDLPTEGALAALRRLRSRRGRNAATPVVVLAAAEEDETLRAQLIGEGFHGLLVKPFSHSELVSAIAYTLAAPKLGARQRRQAASACEPLSGRSEPQRARRRS